MAVEVHTSDPTYSSPLRLITRREARQRLGGISRATEWRMIQRGALPRPRTFGNRTGYLSTEFDVWLREHFGADAE
jgi:predicted DNA-binding transcriptional regulator AlpA